MRGLSCLSQLFSGQFISIYMRIVGITQISGVSRKSTDLVGWSIRPSQRLGTDFSSSYYVTRLRIDRPMILSRMKIIEIP